MVPVSFVGLRYTVEVAGAGRVELVRVGCPSHVGRLGCVEQHCKVVVVWVGGFHPMIFLQVVVAL